MQSSHAGGCCLVYERVPSNADKFVLVSHGKTLAMDNIVSVLYYPCSSTGESGYGRQNLPVNIDNA